MRKLVSVRIALFAALFAAQAACGVFAAQENRAGENPGGGERQKKVAVYARNDSGDKALDSKVRTFELAVAARLNNMGFGVIDRGIAAESLDAYLSPARAGEGRSGLRRREMRRKIRRERACLKGPPDCAWRSSSGRTTFWSSDFRASAPSGSRTGDTA